MGCDIHIIVEVKKNNLWIVNTDKVFKNTWWEEYNKWIANAEKDGNLDKVKALKDTYLKEGEYITIPDDNRSYDWFAILADVRNGRGFAGIKTGEGFNIISEPRGIPDDASEEWKQFVEDWGCDLHSKSYLSIEDFENFNWDQVTVKRGSITLEQYKELRGTNSCPNGWSGSVSGGNVVTVDEDIANDILDGKNKDYEFNDIYVNYHWTIKYSEWFEGKLENLLQPMKKLKSKYEDVRIVFGFDN